MSKPLACTKCGGPVIVERGGNKRRIRGKLRTVANVVCLNRCCNHERWSVSKQAIQQMRRQDRI